MPWSTPPPVPPGMLRSGVIEAAVVRLERRPHGIAVYGPVRVSDLSNLSRGWQAEGYTIADADVAAHLGATLAVTTAEGSRAWREELGL